MSRRQYADGIGPDRPRPRAQLTADDFRPAAATQPDNKPTTSQRPQQSPRKTKRLKRPGKRVIIVSAVTIILLAVAGGGFAYHQASRQKVVPEALIKQMPFPIYYPDPKKLPAGYTIDESSFTSPAKGVVLYAVDYKGGKLVFSVQPKPSAAELSNFDNERIPLHTTLNTPIGTATIGAIGQQSIVSLPTNGNAWVIVTGPYNTDQKKQAAVLRSLKPTT